MPVLPFDIARFVGFSEADAKLLCELHGHAEPRLPAIADEFLAQVSASPGAQLALAGQPYSQSRLRQTLVAWMSTALLGPHDEAYYQRRAQIGLTHVRVGLPQRFLLAAMNIMRRGLRRAARDMPGMEGDRLARLHDALDRLLDLELAVMLEAYREEAEERLRRTERLATVGQLASSIGHDLRNPLGVIESSLYILEKHLDDGDHARRHVARIHAQVEICDNIISNLLGMARCRQPTLEPVDLEDVFGKAISCISVPEQIVIEREVARGTALEADPGLLRQAVANLVSNAIEAYDGEAGTVRLSAAPVDGWVVVEVSDDGPGFDELTLPMAFEPLVTTRRTGTGLGLALVKGIVERHGGGVEATNRRGGGAIVRMRLPAGRPAAVEQTG